MRFNFVSAAYKKITKRAYDDLYAAAEVASYEWYKFFVTEFNKPKHGNWYYNPRTKKMYQASKGDKTEYPAERTGKFLETLVIKPAKYNPTSGSVRIYLISQAGYDDFLFDTRRLFDESKTDFFVRFFKAQLLSRAKGN